MPLLQLSVVQRRVLRKQRLLQIALARNLLGSQNAETPIAQQYYLPFNSYQYCIYGGAMGRMNQDDRQRQAYAKETKKEMIIKQSIISSKQYQRNNNFFIVYWSLMTPTFTNEDCKTSAAHSTAVNFSSACSFWNKKTNHIIQRKRIYGEGMSRLLMW